MTTIHGTVGAPADMPSGLPNCGVVSFAMITGRSHAEAWETLKAYQPGRGRGWRGRTNDHCRIAALRADGVVLTTTRKSRGRAVTLAAWRSGAPFGMRGGEYDPAGTYELVITGHALTLHKGVLYDQHHPKGIAIGDYRGGRKHVRTVTRIYAGSPLTTGLSFTPDATT